MSANPPPTPASSPDPQADARYYRDTLHDLIDMGTAIARRVHARAMAEPEPQAAPPVPPAPQAPALPDHTVPFDRIARTIRRTIALARSLAEPPQPAHPRAAARRHILRKVEDAIDRAAHLNRRPIDADALRAELHERLDAPELAEALDDDIAARPIAEIITEICRDLGLGLDDMPGTCPARRRTPADIATLGARAAHASPSTTLRPVRRPPSRPAPAAVPPGLDDMLALCATLIRDG